MPQVALEFSRQRFPEDPIVSVLGDDLPDFDGALLKAKMGRKGWGIIYNDAIASRGRINFTLAHEFGHYLLHRSRPPQRFSVWTAGCGALGFGIRDSGTRRAPVLADESAQLAFHASPGVGAVFDPVAERNPSAHPDALPLRGGDLVAIRSPVISRSNWAKDSRTPASWMAARRFAFPSDRTLRSC